MKFKINWLKVAEIGGWLLAAAGTFVGGYFGTRNAAKETIDEEISKLTKEKEDKKES